MPSSLPNCFVKANPIFTFHSWVLQVMSINFINIFSNNIIYLNKNDFMKFVSIFINLNNKFSKNIICLNKNDVMKLV